MARRALIAVLAAAGTGLVGSAGVRAGTDSIPAQEGCCATLYAAATGLEGQQGNNPSSLYTIDPSTGAYELIGAIGFNGVSGIAFHPGTGVLYGSANNGSDASVLITIDPETGAGTLVGEIVNSSEGFGEMGEFTGLSRVPDIDFAPDGTLYAHVKQGFGGGFTALFTVDLETGDGTFVGQTNRQGGGNGMAIDAEGAIFAFPSDSFFSCMVTLDAGTGAATCVTNDDGVQGEVFYNAMAFCPESGDLFASDIDRNIIVTLALDSGAVTASSFGTVAGVDAIAFSCPRAFACIENPADCDEEVNNYCPPVESFEIDRDGKTIAGTLAKRLIPDCEPDTYLLVFDKTKHIVRSDDNSSCKGNGWASGLFGLNAGQYGGLTNNTDGTYSLRMGVTGRSDGFDGNMNGLFLNAPHGQRGEFTLCVTWTDSEGESLGDFVTLPDGTEVANPVIYIDEFRTGAEAFYINLIAPIGGESGNDWENVYADVCIDNTTGLIEIGDDIDVFRLTDLVPLCDYCITQVGGLDHHCRPTQIVMGWLDKNCGLISLSNTYNDHFNYDELCVVADFNGVVDFFITSEEFRGDIEDYGFPGHVHFVDDRAPVECAPETFGTVGCYTLSVRVVGLHGDGAEPMGPGNNGEPEAGESGVETAALQRALDHGDLNRDGVTNTADLGIMLGNFGWLQQ